MERCSARGILVALHEINIRRNTTARVGRNTLPDSLIWTLVKVWQLFLPKYDQQYFYEMRNTTELGVLT